MATKEEAVVNNDVSEPDSSNDKTRNIDISKPETEETSEKKKIRKTGYAAIKEEFLILDHKPVLNTQYLSLAVKEKMVPGKHPPSTDTADESEPPNKKPNLTDGNKAPPNAKPKLTGRNKHRPGNEKILDRDRICPAVKDDRECSYGDRCKYSHNKEEFMKNKLPEMEGSCYLFDTFGRCQFGIACRFSRNHLTEDLKNIVNHELYEKMKDSKKFLNEMDPEVKQKLWKKKYNFSKADRIFKEVERKFRGSGFKSSRDLVRVNEGGNNNTIDNGNTNVGSEAAPASVGKAESGVVTETPIENTQSDSVSVTSSDAASTVEKRTLGCITDEEIIRLRPEEKVKVGNLPFRRVCKELGADITCGEMALVNNLLKAKQSEWSLMKRHPSEDIFGVQICGSYPDVMTRCAQLLTETCKLDFIDINCGCPIDMIYKWGGGSALMGKITKLEQICRSMIGVMGDTPLTVKVRTGVFDNKSVAHQLIPRLRDAGVSLVTVHGRSREQRYTRLADWDYISQCAAVGAPMPVFGNGDILSYEDANLHMKHSGVGGVMIARGALIKPWIFTEIKEQRHWDISSGERFDILKKYTNYGLEHWGSDQQGVENTRRFLLEWLSFLHRYIPVGVLEQVPQRINERPPYYVGRNDLETLMASANCGDWVKLSEMLLGPVPPKFEFLPKHKANAYQ